MGFTPDFFVAVDYEVPGLLVARYHCLYLLVVFLLGSVFLQEACGAEGVHHQLGQLQGVELVTGPRQLKQIQHYPVQPLLLPILLAVAGVEV